MEVILLWKKTKTFFGLSIIPNIITEKWGYRQSIYSPFRQEQKLFFGLSIIPNIITREWRGDESTAVFGVRDFISSKGKK